MPCGAVADRHRRREGGGEAALDRRRSRGGGRRRAPQGAPPARCCEVIRVQVGLGEAMAQLDRSKGEGSSQLDDLEALEQVADLHPTPETFEVWLRGLLGRPPDRDGDHPRHRAQGEGSGVARRHRVRRDRRARARTGWPTISRRSGGCSTSPSPGAVSASSCWPMRRSRRRSSPELDHACAGPPGRRRAE